MADAVFRGDAAAVAEVRYSTFGGTDPTGSETVTVTINDKEVVTVVGGLTVDTAGDAVALACNDSTIPEFSEITWTYDSATNRLTATADTAGQKIDFTIAESSATMTVGAVTEDTANNGPSVLSIENLDIGAYPGAADDLYIEQTSVDLLYDMLALEAIALGTVHIENSYEGSIGLSRTNEDGDYLEWRDRYLELDADNIIIGDGPGDGSPRLQLDTQTAATNVQVFNTNVSSDDLHALRIRGSNASNELHVSGSSTVEIAPDGTDAAQYSKIVATGTSRVRISRRVTVGTLEVGGSAVVEIDTDAAVATITTITVRGNATVIITGDNSITTLDIGDNANVSDECSGGTITTLYIGSTASYSTVSSGADAGDRTVTNTTLSPGATLSNGRRVVTFTNPIDLGLGGLRDYPSLDLGSGIDIQVS